MKMITHEYRNNIGKIIKQQRQAANLTLNELSASSGVSPSHLGRIEKGERFPSAFILQRIAKPLGFDVNEMFTLAGYLSPHLPEEEEKSPANRYELDPYVARMLSQETVEVQRAVVSILTVLKSVASGITPAKQQEIEGYLNDPSTGAASN
jgi:transcriptional regulator with XRE-family HTH domain